MRETDQLAALTALYREIDDAIGRFLERHPAAACPDGCHRCCCAEAPLVSGLEFALIERHLAEIEPALRDAVAGRAAALRAALEAGAPDSFVCPLLEAGRCLVYPVRPYLCRSFGHSARRDEDGVLRPYTCHVVRPHLARAAPPELRFRIGALRELVTGGRIVDSLLPIWLSTTADQRAVRWIDEHNGVLTADTAHRRIQEER
ncbi:MAG: YkgJ family cysteine cluster protein [Deltaproteobacteria bacterium]|nr:YkgJ family cysteine cluster protein [Deltaproteobacteria bacterium]